VAIFAASPSKPKVSVILAPFRYLTPSTAVSVTIEAIPDLKVTVTYAFAQGPLAAAEVVREGTHNGSVTLPDGTPVPPSGRTVRLPECLVFTVRDGKVTRMAPYVDMLDSLRQLGVLMAPDRSTT
jgi:predicted ester cyclase